MEKHEIFSVDEEVHADTIPELERDEEIKMLRKIARAAHSVSYYIYRHEPEVRNGIMYMHLSRHLSMALREFDELNFDTRPSREEVQELADEAGIRVTFSERGRGVTIHHLNEPSGGLGWAYHYLKNPPEYEIRKTRRTPHTSEHDNYYYGVVSDPSESTNSTIDLDKTNKGYQNEDHFSEMERHRESP